MPQPQIDFTAIVKQLETGLAQLASTSVKEYTKDATNDGIKMLDSLKSDLQAWTLQLANGDISAKDLEYLVNSKNSLIQMDALKQAGLAAVRIDQFKISAIQLVTSTITSLIKV